MPGKAGRARRREHKLLRTEQIPDGHIATSDWARDYARKRVEHEAQHGPVRVIVKDCKRVEPFPFLAGPSAASDPTPLDRPLTDQECSEWADVFVRALKESEQAR